MTPGRNDPCPCGSGKKYKKCHLRATEEEQHRKRKAAPHPFARKAHDPVPPEVLSELRRMEQVRAMREARFGMGRDIVHTDFQGFKFVGVGARLFYSKDWRTFTDFLLYYIKARLGEALGEDWGNKELAKPLAERHQILQWYDALCAFQRRHEFGPDGIAQGVPDGPSMAYISLAYDLYLLGHHQTLQDSVVTRLRHQDQFQGARYELAVAATMVRAGFELTHEEETDPTRKHPEFIATHPGTGERIAVEAKSRHRAGVLGRAGVVPTHHDFRLGIEGLFKKALAKDPQLPFVIFIDANMPPDIATAERDRWLAELHEVLPRIGSEDSIGKVAGASYTCLVLTNFPHHYGERAAMDPAKLAYFTSPQPSLYPFKSDETQGMVERAVLQYGNIPRQFP